MMMVECKIKGLVVWFGETSSQIAGLDLRIIVLIQYMCDKMLVNA